MTWFNLSLRLVTLLVMLVGLVGLVIPIFPGIIVIWLAALGYGLAVGFGGSGGWVFAVLTVLMLVGAFADNVLTAKGAHEGGAAWYSILASIVAGLVGTYWAPPFGGLIAAPLTLLGVEYWRKRNLKEAWQAARGYLWGCGWAFVLRFSLGVVMILLWAFFWAW
ncbi:MAG: DUF456 domain-containing protein [Chloroflexi bacterium]|nr:DUF456 domain-containing protein [Chloroflexota bacterium]